MLSGRWPYSEIRHNQFKKVGCRLGSQVPYCQGGGASKWTRPKQKRVVFLLTPEMYDATLCMLVTAVHKHVLAPSLLGPSLSSSLSPVANSYFTQMVA